MNQYYCKNYISMIFYHSLSSQNRILNSANHGVKNEEISKEASFLHFLDLLRPYCFLHVSMVWHYMESYSPLATNRCKGQKNGNRPWGNTGAVAREANYPKYKFKWKTEHKRLFQRHSSFSLSVFKRSYPHFMIYQYQVQRSINHVSHWGPIGAASWAP